jgi:hypothetical protein
MKHIRTYEDNQWGDEDFDTPIVHPITENTCYVAHQGISDIIKLFDGKRVDLEFYPETELTLLERKTGVKYNKSIITESVELICCYDSSNVYIWQEGKWVNPVYQTYGTSFRILENRLLGFRGDICMNIVSGTDAVATANKIKDQYK